MAQEQKPWFIKFSEKREKKTAPLQQEESSSSTSTTTVSIPSKQQSLYLSDLEELVGNAISTFLCTNQEHLLEGTVDRAHAIWEAKTCGNPQDIRIDSYKYPVFIQAYILDDNVSNLQFPQAYMKGDKTIRDHAKEVTRGWKNMTDTMQDRTLFNSDWLITEYLNAAEKILALLDERTMVMDAFETLKKTIYATVCEKDRRKADLLLKNYILSSPMFQGFQTVDEDASDDTGYSNTTLDSDSVEPKEHSQPNPNAIRKGMTYYLIEDGNLVCYYKDDDDDGVDAEGNSPEDLACQQPLANPANANTNPQSKAGELKPLPGHKRGRVSHDMSYMDGW
jgi:hypothetical protein